ncbi:hypothetical protein EV385_1253 [Krasilnikovia cinnamomea]|uniref:Uncharacterized protein n=1 Tax=Krasilnikovia cinnamomea TaxID=349313 RepID=A0A4Q7ZGL5_9ACTN|nr:hypothetical protein [Krasilnikovia cinnamomea]RZU49501.1 hypothetical protein EV385_1253 [Krasilnikovia cinnamomea]
MAEMLKRRYDLNALKVRLLADADPPSVRCELELTREHQSEPVASWQLPATELGLPPVLDCATSHGTGYEFRLPDAMAAELAQAVRGAAVPERPLWLHLVRPYGHLGLVPWEQLLVPVLPVPVLRLPDFVVEPVRSRRAVTVALCADDGPGDLGEQADLVGRLAAAIVGAIPLPTTLHIFPTAQLYERLRHIKSPVDRTDRVLLHDPAALGDDTSGTYAGADRAPVYPGSTDSAVGQHRNDWLTWMRDALCGHGVDVVHFLAGAVLRLDQGALALSDSPADPDDTGLSVVSTAALTRFLLQVGAWGCGFTSPPGNPSEMGLRLVATTVAGLRPTALLHHEARLDPGLRALADGYRLMTSPDPALPPTDGAVFVYCQPFQVATEPGRDELPGVVATAPGAAPSDKVRGLVTDAPATPTWVSASQRFVEQYEWRLHQWNDAQPVPEQLTDGVAKALELIQGVVDRYADAPAVEPQSPPPPAMDISDAPGDPEVPR